MVAFGDREGMTSRLVDSGFPTLDAVLDTPSPRCAYPTQNLSWASVIAIFSAATIAVQYGRWLQARSNVVAAPAVDLTTPPKILTAFGPMRFLASVHIVLGHLVRKKDVIPTWHFNQYGYTWVPWFFMLSGFILTHARLASSKPAICDPEILFMRKRLTSIYPLYLCTLLLAIVIKLHEGGSLPSLKVLLCQILLLQSWDPRMTEHCLQAHCWFLSSILPFWYFFRVLYFRLKGMSIEGVSMVALICCFLPWSVILVPWLLDEPLNWYSAHKWGKTGTMLDVVVIGLKFHPLCYWHIFVLGCATARILHHYRDRAKLQKSIPFVLRYGATIAMVSLSFIFCSPSLQPPGAKLSCRLGILAPLQMLLIIGLGLQYYDPFARLLCVPAVATLGLYSFPQYCLQFICYSLWSSQSWLDCGRRATVAFFAFLFASSIAGHHLQIHAGRFFVSYQRILVWSVVPAGIMMLALLQSSNLAKYASRRPTAPSMRTPAFVWYNDRAQDYRLNLSKPFDSTSVPINPSILCSSDHDGFDDHCIVAARYHRTQSDIRIRSMSDNIGTNEGHHNPKMNVNARIHTTVWHSDIWLGILNSTTMSLVSPMSRVNLLYMGNWRGAKSADGRVGGMSVSGSGSAETNTAPKSWYPCEVAPHYHPGNGTWTQQVSTGPEDPRLLLAPSRATLRPQSHSRSQSQSQVNLLLTAYSTLPAAVPGVACPQSGAVGAMFTAVLDLRTLTRRRSKRPTDIKAVATQLDWVGSNKQAGAREKNWLMFMHRGTVYTVYTVQPHLILECVAQSPGHSSRCVERFRTSSPDFYAIKTLLRDGESASAVHGGSNAVRIATESGVFYLAVCHVSVTAKSLFGAKTKRRYINMLYKFEPKPPFRILGVSRPLELVGDGTDDQQTRSFAFVSGLALRNAKGKQQLLISYGVADREPRVLVLSMEAAMSFFEKARNKKGC